MEARAGNSILDFETLFSDFQELLNGSGLTSALLRAAKRTSTRQRRPEGRLRASIQCPWQRPQPGAPPFSAIRKTHHCAFFCLEAELFFLSSNDSVAVQC